MAEKNPFVIGFVSQSRLSPLPHLLQFTPGVHSTQSGDDLSQTYTSPAQAILEKGADVIIVGRGITKSDDPAAAAKQYRDESWAAYVKRVAISTKL